MTLLPQFGKFERGLALILACMLFLQAIAGFGVMLVALADRSFERMLSYPGWVFAVWANVAGFLGLIALSVWRGVPTLRVQSFRCGRLMIDGRPATIPELVGAVKRAKRRGGVVWFYREGASEEPTESQFEAFKAIVDLEPKIALSTKADFSEAFDPRTARLHRLD